MVSRGLLFGAMITVGAALPLAAQASYEAPNGTVEVLGLRRWTLQMLRDSIRRYVPGQDLHDAACMVTLRDSLGFAEASVNHWMGMVPGNPTKEFLAIKVLEPQEKARVQWDVRPRDEYSGLLPDYAPLILPITDTAGGVWRGRLQQWTQYYMRDSATRAERLSHAPAVAKADAERVWGFLDARRGEADRRRAMVTLRKNGFWVNRFVAATILVNFPAQDSTWWALVRALRDPHESVRDFAAGSLSAMKPRRVDWSPVAADLRLLIGGTSLPTIETVFDLLDNTQVSPALAPQLLRGNAEWLLEHLASRAPMSNGIAHRLLVRLNGGVDLGKRRVDWEPWVAKL